VHPVNVHGMTSICAFSLSAHARRAALAAVSLTCLLISIVFLTTAAPAGAVGSFAYGEVTRFGGFDASAYNGGAYGGALTPGKFLDVTGFAVDTQDAEEPQDTALYVVDRTSGVTGTKTDWRLQKLNDEGTPVGVTTFTLPNEPSEARSAIVALAVDDALGRVYALVAGDDENGSEQAYAKEILAWSIHPDEAGKLVAAKEGLNALPPDPLGSTGGLISGEAKLAAGLSHGDALYDPQGLALDVTGGHRYLVIEATNNKGSGPSGVSGMLGSAVVQQVDPSSGDLVGTWLASAKITSPVSEQQAGPRGISTNPDGSLTVLLGAAPAGITDVDAIELSADLSSYKQLIDNEDTPSDFDRAAAYLAPAPGPFSAFYVAQQPGAGPGLIQLDPASGELYAATFAGSAGISDSESPTGSNFYWTQADQNLGDVANIGVRLLQPAGSGEISNTEGATIVNTLGGAVLEASGNPLAGGVCNLDAEEQALAAGANGTLWLLGAGIDTIAAAGNPGASLGREIVELAPGAATACPQPSGNFSASKSEVFAGAKVEFNAETVDLQHGVPFAYEWEFGEGPKLVNKLGLWPRTSGGSTTEVMSWPPPTATFQYNKPGKYTVKLRIVSEYGTYEAPAQTVTVVEATPPQAHFSVATPNPTAGQPITFNATESVVFNGATIANYHWEWGDGASEDVQASGLALHTYSAPGAYTVKLTVKDSNGFTSKEAFVKTVTVAAAEEAHTSTQTQTATTTSTSTSGGGTPSNHEPTVVSPHASVAAGGVLKTTVSCPASKVSCAGTVEVKTATAIAASVADVTATAAKKSKKKARKSQLVLGSSSFSLAGGTSQTITVHLSSKGIALLDKSKSLRVLVVVAAHDSFGDPSTQTLSVILHAAARKGGHHGKH
jgi:PKD repeat protein